MVSLITLYLEINKCSFKKNFELYKNIIRNFFTFYYHFYLLHNYLYSSIVFILNSLKISTIIIGENTSNIVSKILFVGKTGILNIFLNVGINSITKIRQAEIIVAPIRILLLNTFVLNIDFLL